MINGRQWRVLLAIILASATAMGAPGKGTEAGKIYFDCDTTPGHSSEVDLPVADGQRKVTGSIKPIQLYQIERWLPSAQVRLSEQDGRRWISLALMTAMPSQKVVDKDASVTLAIRRSAGAEAPIEQEAIGTLPLNKDLPFELSIRADHMVVNIGGEAHVVDFKLAGPPKLALVCSTGEFEFIDILVN